MLFANRICRSVLAIVCVRVSVMTGAADQHDKALLSLHVDDARMYTVHAPISQHTPRHTATVIVRSFTHNHRFKDFVLLPP